jgi:hypothetical protein
VAPHLWASLRGVGAHRTQTRSYDHRAVVLNLLNPMCRNPNAAWWQSERNIWADSRDSTRYRSVVVLVLNIRPMSLTVLAAFPVIATAQSDNPTVTVPKPTIADVQKVVQTISSDKTKLRAYCDIGKLQDQIRRAQEKNDTKALDFLDAKIGSLEQQIGPEYAKVIEGLAEVDPNSAEGWKFTAVFNILHKQCK